MKAETDPIFDKEVGDFYVSNLDLCPGYDFYYHYKLGMSRKTQELVTVIIFKKTTNSEFAWKNSRKAFSLS